MSKPYAQPTQDPADFRTPLPIDRFDLFHPAVPAELEGLTILHLSDLHTRRFRPRFRTLARTLSRVEPDLIALTGDLMTHPGDEPVALRVLADLAGSWRCRLGAFGVFGNHDSPPFRRMVQATGSVRWLDGEVAPIPGLPLQIAGTSWPEDWLALGLALQDAADAGAGGDGRARFTIGLCHVPSTFPIGSRFGLPIVLAGHTHGGQWRLRLPWLKAHHFAPHTSTDLPAHWASGVLRHHDTLCCITRGLGEQVIELRIMCPPQAAMYRLRQSDHNGMMPRNAPPGADGNGVMEAVRRW